MIMWICKWGVQSVEQKSCGLKFFKSQSGSDVTTAATIILIFIVSLYFCIRHVSVSSIHDSQACWMYINETHHMFFFFLIWSQT